jgi:hypothetical protein
VVGDHNNIIIVVLMSMIVADLTCRKHSSCRYRSCAIVLRSKHVQRWAEERDLSLSPWDVRMAIAKDLGSSSRNVSKVYFVSAECQKKNYDILLVKERVGGNQFTDCTIARQLKGFSLKARHRGVLVNAQTEQKLDAGKELLYTDADDDDDDDDAAAAADQGKVQRKGKRKISSSSSSSSTQTKPKKRNAPAQSSNADADAEHDADYDTDHDAASMPHSAAAGLSAEFMSKAVKDLHCDPTTTAVVHALISRIKCLSNVAASALINVAESLDADTLDEVSTQRSMIVARYARISS